MHKLKAIELATSTGQQHILWWYHAKRRFRVSCRDWVEAATKSGQFGGKSHVIYIAEVAS